MRRIDFRSGGDWRHEPAVCHRRGPLLRARLLSSAEAGREDRSCASPSIGLTTIIAQTERLDFPAVASLDHFSFKVGGVFRKPPRRSSGKAAQIQ